MLDNYDNLVSVPLPHDNESYTGRECPQCQTYFKIVFGTGLKGTIDCLCPYCGYKAHQSHFATQEQIEYAQSVIFSQVADEFFQTLKGLEGRYPKHRSLFNLEVKVTRGDSIQIAHYTEKDLETKIICSNCTLSYAVYGVFAFCPDCGQHNSQQILLSNFEVINKLLDIAQNSEQAVMDALFESCLAKTVAAFDGYGRELCAIYAAKTADPAKAVKVSFQNIANAKSHCQMHFNFDMTSQLSQTEWEYIIRLFQKRHLLSHTAGEIDDEYLAKANDPTAIKGHKVTLSHDELVNFIDLVKGIASHIDTQFRSIYGNPI